MKLHRIELISKSRDQVFPWIADPKKAEKWQTNVKSEEVVREEPEMVGTTFKET